jgi:hypothetical protein
MNMAYPESCFTNLIGIRGVCEPALSTPLYWLDDVPGIDLNRLAQIAEANAPTGENTGMLLIESAARFLTADVEAIYDAQYKVQNTILNGCSLCTFTGNYATGNQRGTKVTDHTESSLSTMVIDKFLAKVNATGTFTVVLDDGEQTLDIVHDFQAGYEYDFTGVNFATKRKSVRIYLAESNVPLAQLSCPRTGSGCGCSGKSAAVSDLSFTGTANGADNSQAYGFIPCVFIRCDAADLLCYLAHSAQRMVGMALLYKTAELYYLKNLQVVRNNRVAGTNVEEAKEDAKRYAKLYIDKLNGNATRGIKDLVFTTLQQTSDVCVVCTAKIATSWATG